MNKKELVDVMAEDTGFTKKKCNAAVKAFTEAIKEGLQSDGRAGLVGFGSFTVVDRSARKGRNPKTGEAIDIPAKKAVKFKPAEDLKSVV